jgi:hypothetical protein
MVSILVGSFLAFYWILAIVRCFNSEMFDG